MRIELPAHAETIRARPGLRRLLRPAFARSPEGVLPLLRRFRVWDPWKRDRIEGIVRAFLAGYNAMVWSDTLDAVRERLDALPRYYRPFAYEGTGMGFGAWAWFRGADLGAFEAVVHSLTPATLYQNYVGFGWWLDLWRVRPRRIADLARRMDYRYGLITYEGIGFRTGFLHPLDRGCVRRFDRFDADARHVCYQGYGRSLWFVYMDELRAAIERIAELEPAVRGDCYSGLGLGTAYSMIDRPATFAEVLRLIPDADRPDFLQGAAFGWEARQLADPRLFDEQFDRAPADRRDRVQRALGIVHRARDLLDASGVRTAFYQHWRERTRTAIAGTGLFASAV